MSTKIDSKLKTPIQICHLLSVILVSASPLAIGDPVHFRTTGIKFSDKFARIFFDSSNKNLHNIDLKAKNHTNVGCEIERSNLE